MGVAAFNGTNFVVIAGGEDSRKCQVFDPVKKLLYKCPDLPHPIVHGTVVQYKNR